MRQSLQRWCQSPKVISAPLCCREDFCRGHLTRLTQAPNDCRSCAGRAIGKDRTVGIAGSVRLQQHVFRCHCLVCQRQAHKLHACCKYRGFDGVSLKCGRDFFVRAVADDGGYSSGCDVDHVSRIYLRGDEILRGDLPDIHVHRVMRVWSGCPVHGASVGRSACLSASRRETQCLASRHS